MLFEDFVKFKINDKNNYLKKYFLVENKFRLLLKNEKLINNITYLRAIINI